MRLPKELKEFDFMKREKRKRNNHLNNGCNNNSNKELPSHASERLEKIFFGMISVFLKVLEAIFSIYLGVIVVPLLAILWGVNELVRFLVISPLLQAEKYGRGKYELVSSAEDNVWSFRKPKNSRNILIFSVYKSNPTNPASTSTSSSSSSSSSYNIIDVDTYGQKLLDKVINYVDPKGRRPYDKLKRILTQKLGYCVWEHTEDKPTQVLSASCENRKLFDIKNHIRILDSTHILNKDFVAESDLPLILSELTGDMSEDKPQWEEIILPKFVYDADLQQYEIERERVNSSVGEGGDYNTNSQYVRTAKIFRFHHGYMDGLSALSMMTRACNNSNNHQEEEDSKTSILDLDPLSPLKISRWKFLGQVVHLLTFGTFRMIRGICNEMYADSRFLTPRFKGRIIHGWSEPIDMSDLDKIRNKIGRKEGGNKKIITNTEIFISCLGAALRAVSGKFCKKATWLIFPDTLEGSCFLGLVRAILPHSSEGPKNRFGVVGFDIDTSPIGGKEDQDNWAVTTRLQRFESARKLYQEQVDGSPLVILNHGLQRLIGRFPVFVMQYLLRDSGCPVVLSNIPWVKTKLQLMGEDKVGGRVVELEEFAGWMPMLSSTGLGITTAKYGDKMRFCAVTEAGCLSSQELNYFLTALRMEISSILSECNSEELSNNADNCKADYIIQNSNNASSSSTSSCKNTSKVHSS